MALLLYIRSSPRRLSNANIFPHDLPHNKNADIPPYASTPGRNPVSAAEDSRFRPLRMSALDVLVSTAVLVQAVESTAQMLTRSQTFAATASSDLSFTLNIIGSFCMSMIIGKSSKLTRRVGSSAKSKAHKSLATTRRSSAQARGRPKHL